MSVRSHRGGYLVRVYPFPAKVFPKGAKKAAEEYDLKLKVRRLSGDVYDEPTSTLGDEIDGYLAWKQATGALSDAGLRSLRHAAKLWQPFRKHPIQRLRRPDIEDHVTYRAVLHARSAKEGRSQPVSATLRREYLLAS